MEFQVHVRLKQFNTQWKWVQQYYYGC